MRAVDVNQPNIDCTQVYEAEAARLRQIGWQERKPLLLPELTLGEWDGTCETACLDGGTRKVQYRVVYWQGFPWRKPTVWPVDPRYNRSLHLSAPSTEDERKYAEKAALGDRLCIWDDYIGWDPELMEQEVPARIHGWFEHAENGWPDSEGQILDPERYFANAGPLLFAGAGLADLKRPLGVVRIVASDHIGLIQSIDGRPCPSYTTALAALRLAPKLELTMPYVLLARQPTMPVFDNVRGLRDEATRQGIDGHSLIQHLSSHLVTTSPSSRPQKHRGKQNRRHRHNNPWPQAQTLPLPQPAAEGETSLRLLLVYPVGDQMIGCQLILPKLKPKSMASAGSRQDRLHASLDEKLVSGAVRSLDSGSLLKRNPQRVNVHEVSAASVMLLGLGSVGSMMAELLVKAGVKRVVLADADILEPGNVIRHTCGMEGVGHPKAIAVRDRLRSIRHDGEYEIIRDATGQEIQRCDIIQSLDSIVARATACSLVLDCTGSEAVLQAVSKSCRMKVVPFMSVGTYYSAAVGQVLAVIPGQPCLECLRKALRHHPDIDVPVLKEDDAVAAEGCAAVTSPASAADLATTCSLAAQASIDLLLGKGLAWHQRLWVGRTLRGAPAGSVFTKAPQVVDSSVDASRCDLCRT